MAVKLLERLTSKIRFMHLEVPGSIGHLYTMQVALTSAANSATDYLLEQFLMGVYFWRDICKSMDTRLTYIADIVHREASYLGNCNASGVGVGGV